MTFDDNWTADGAADWTEYFKEQRHRTVKPFCPTCGAKLNDAAVRTVSHVTSDSRGVVPDDRPTS